MSDVKLSSSLSSLFIIPPDDNRTTFGGDESLPALPLPDLRHTLDRYLDSLKPFVTPQEYAKTIEVVRSFEGGLGKVLQDKLKKKAEIEKNWVEKWWESQAYLLVRQPLILCNNMNGVIPKDLFGWTYGTEDDQIKHASLFGYYTTRFWHLIRSEKLLPYQSEKKINFSMSQYKKLFNTARIPGDEIDSMVHYFKTISEGQCPSTVIILCKGRFFCINIVNGKGDLISPQEWEEVLKSITKFCSESYEGGTIGILTCDSRTKWSKNRRRLRTLSKKNEEILELIDKSLFVLILDEDCPETDSDVAQANMCGNYFNRWSDKSVCIIFYKNGRSGSLSDHTAFDGIVALSCTHFVVTALEESIQKSDKCESSLEVTAPNFIELKFDLDDGLLEEIKRVKNETDQYYFLISGNQKCEISISKHDFDDYGKTEIRKLNYHSDSYIQMVIQLAYVALHGKPAPCYETASTRKFYNGRTETLRSCTVESLEWVASMMNNQKTDLERKILFDKAIKRHDELMKEARENRGCDRHLLGLYCVALEEELPIPELFSDPSYTKSGGGGNFILSTSCTGYTNLGGGVNPMCIDGYGVFYNILPSSILFTLSVNKSSKETNVYQYFESLKASFRRTRQVLIRAKRTSKL